MRGRGVGGRLAGEQPLRRPRTPERRPAGPGGPPGPTPRQGQGRHRRPATNSVAGPRTGRGARPRTAPRAAAGTGVFVDAEAPVGLDEGVGRGHGRVPLRPLPQRWKGDLSRAAGAASGAARRESTPSRRRYVGHRLAVPGGEHRVLVGPHLRVRGEQQPEHERQHGVRAPGTFRGTAAGSGSGSRRPADAPTHRGRRRWRPPRRGRLTVVSAAGSWPPVCRGQAHRTVLGQPGSAARPPPLPQCSDCSARTEGSSA